MLAAIAEVAALKHPTPGDTPNEDAPFVVRVLHETDGRDVCRRSDEKRLDSYWDAEVMDGRGIVPPGAIEASSFYVYGRTHKLPTPDSDARP